MISALMVKIKMPIARTDLRVFGFLHHLIWHAGKMPKKPWFSQCQQMKIFSLGMCKSRSVSVVIIPGGFAKKIATFFGNFG